MNRHILFIITLVVGLFAINWLNNDSQNTMPELSFTDIDKQTHSLAQYQGKPILMIFWATDCPGCIKEMPALIKLHETYAEQGLTMIGVAMSHDSLRHIKTMREKRKLPYIITWDHNTQIARAFGNVRVTPTHFLIDSTGQIVMRKIGAIDLTRLEQKLQNLGLNSI
ncbi:MAG: peroxiredoxin family protein [Methylophagaceae bacterium]